MSREIDERKKRKALRKLRKAAELAESGLGPPLSEWEEQFLEEVEERIEKFGSAFGDPLKGNLDEPLSALQARKLKEIDKKARGKGKGGFKNKGSSFKKKDSAPRRSYGRDINDDIEEAVEEQAPPPRPEEGKGLALVRAADLMPPPPYDAPQNAPDQLPKRPAKGGFKPRVIKGGKAGE